MKEDASHELTHEAVVKQLKLVEDPELFLDIYFLGLIYDIKIDGSRVDIEMTFTTPTCPSGPHLVAQVEEKVRALAGVDEVFVRVVFSPPWTASDEVRGLLGML